MSLKRECDRCQKLAPVDSLNGRDFRVVRIERGSTASSDGGASMIYKTSDLCKNCVASLERWLDSPPVKVTAG